MVLFVFLIVALLIINAQIIETQILKKHLIGVIKRLRLNGQEKIQYYQKKIK